jgi:hypothetical protein
MAHIHRVPTWPTALYIVGARRWCEQYNLTGNPGSVWLLTSRSELLCALFSLLSYRTEISTMIAGLPGRSRLASS